MPKGARARVRGAAGPMGEELRGPCSGMGASGEEGEACGGEGPRRGDLDGGDVVHSRGGGAAVEGSSVRGPMGQGRERASVRECEGERPRVLGGEGVER